MRRQEPGLLLQIWTGDILPAHQIRELQLGRVKEDTQNMEDKKLEASLLAAVKELFSGPSREDLSVNTVRTKCEKENGLEEGFFAQGEWKAKSKELIKNQVVCYPSRLAIVSSVVRAQS